MSSSKVIKSTFMEQGIFEPFTFEKLTGEIELKSLGSQTNADFMAFPLGKLGSDAVVPFDGGIHLDRPAEPAPVAVEAPLPVILEEEAVRRVQAAFHDGFREGKQQAEEPLAKVSEALAKALLSTGGLREKVLQESEDDLLKLAIMIARKIIRQEIATDQRILVNLVKSAVELVSEGDEVVVRLNPADYVIVADNKYFAYTDGEKRRMGLKADETVPIGGCVVDTAMGSLDARLEAQLEEIFRLLMEERSSLRAEVENNGGGVEEYAVR